MAINNCSIVFLLLPFFFFFFFSVTHGRSYCPVSHCKESKVKIKFPFWIQDQQPKDCGLSGYNVSCNSQQLPVLDIPNSGRFIVSSISYYSRKIVLKDPHNCLFNRLVTLNLTSSPYRSAYHETYSILSCPKGKAHTYFMEPISCLSNATVDIVAADFFKGPLFQTCNKMMELRLPSSGSNRLDSLELTWGATTMAQRIASWCVFFLFLGAACGIFLVLLGKCWTSASLRNSTRTGVSLRNSIRTGDSLRNSTRTGDSLRNLSSIALSSPNTQEGMTSRSDGSVISSYKKITVGQSQRIEGPNGSTCAICLEDYAVNDTIKFLPECKHCFHDECIDKWLRVNSKCPFCRKSQADSSIADAC